MAEFISESRKIALGIEYNGSKYYGWQRQKEVNSIQEHLESALSQIANEPIRVFCAGRTDAGVHSTGQVVHFETTAVRRKSAWTLGTNSNLPKDIAVNWVRNVSSDFHARFSATARLYRYIIYNHKLRNAISSDNISYYHKRLDAERMNRAAQCLIGEHDFSSFCGFSQCYLHMSPCRNVFYINVRRFYRYIVIDIKANAFLYHMVRNITGNLLKVGTGIYPESWISELLAAKNSTVSLFTAEAKGLYLISVDYPNKFGIPKASSKFFLGKNFLVI